MSVEIIVETTSTATREVVIEKVSGITNKALHEDWISPYQYQGLAAYGTLTSASVWLVYRYEFDLTGTLLNKKSAQNIKWDDRLTATYN
jgi:hypothetical protein